MRNFVLLLVLVCGGACSNETPEPTEKAVYFTESKGGTCGEVEPLHDDLSVVCEREHLGAVTFTELDGAVWTIGCVDSGLLAFDTDKQTGTFRMQTEECSSSYTLARR